MQPKHVLLLIALLLNIHSSFAQIISKDKINTASAEAYFKIASAIESGQDSDAIPWSSLFQTLPYQMMISGNAVDTAALKSEIEKIFSAAAGNETSSLSAKELYHKAYKGQRNQLEQYIKKLHDLNVIDSVKKFLYPLLPSRLQTGELFPTLYYLNYGTADATGFGGVVFNDLLHSYKIDNYKFGLLAAHEAFHSVVSTAFQLRIKKDADYNAPDFSLLYFLENISEEGIADLIDKPLLLQKNSPLYAEVKRLTENDSERSIKLIKRLDSMLTRANNSDQVLAHYNNFPVLANTFGENGGHIPGRFMGLTIKNAGLIPSHIENVEDPISFLLTYNEAAKKSNKNYATFSKESVQYLQKLRAKYLQEKN